MGTTRGAGKASRPLDRIDRAGRALLDKRAQLLRRQETLRRDEEELNAVVEPDWEDAAANRTATDLLDHLSEMDRAELERISWALRRVEAGTYGRCVVCGHRISDSRLSVVPEAVTCTRCGDRPH